MWEGGWKLSKESRCCRVQKLGSETFSCLQAFNETFFKREGVVTLGSTNLNQSFRKKQKQKHHLASITACKSIPHYRQKGFFNILFGR